MVDQSGKPLWRVSIVGFLVVPILPALLLLVLGAIVARYVDLDPLDGYAATRELEWPGALAFLGVSYIKMAVLCGSVLGVLFLCKFSKRWHYLLAGFSPSCLVATLVYLENMVVVPGLKEGGVWPQLGFVVLSGSAMGLALFDLVISVRSREQIYDAVVGRWCVNRISAAPPPLYSFPQPPIAKDSDRPKEIIRFRMLQAITASAFCDWG